MVDLAEVIAGRNSSLAHWRAGMNRVNNYVRIWIILSLGVLIIAYLGRGTLPDAIYSWPVELRIPLQAKANELVDGVLRRSVIAGAPLRVWTRSAGEILGIPMRALQNMLSKGWLIPGKEASDTVRIPPLSWLSIVLVSGYLGWLAAGRNLAFFAILTFLYFLVFNLWQEATLTLASVIVAIVIGTIAGVFSG